MDTEPLSTLVMKLNNNGYSCDGRSSGEHQAITDVPMLGQSNLVRQAGNTILNHRADKTMAGFTLVEVFFSVLLLGVMVVSITGIFFSALDALHAEEDLLPLDSRLRGRMEEIISRSFDAIVDGSESVTINGRNHIITWTVAQPDLDGDAKLESIVKKITVTSGVRSMTTLVVDSNALVRKI